MPTLAEGMDLAAERIERHGARVSRTGSDFLIAYVPLHLRTFCNRDPRPIAEVAELVLTEAGLADGSALERYRQFVAWKRRGDAFRDGRRLLAMLVPVGTEQGVKIRFREATTLDT